MGRGKGEQNPHPCPLNHAVECSEKNRCEKCGWNKEVADLRISNLGNKGKEKPKK